MNYRHEFHAGNFADVFKHILLCRIVEYFKRKEKAFRVIDTHAGSGKYVLPEKASLDANEKPAEWIHGIGRLEDWNPSNSVAPLVKPYLEILFGNDGFPTYLGSPCLVRKLLRKQDRLTACELHPEEFKKLKTHFEGDYQSRIIELDGWLVAGSQLPPKENRGVLFIDPPFELPAEFNRIIDSLEKASKRWNGGTAACWYPLKHDGDVRLFKELLRNSGIPNLTVFEMNIDRPTTPPKLYGSGFVIKNAPFVLEKEMKVIFKELVPLLETGKGRGSWSIDRLTDE